MDLLFRVLFLTSFFTLITACGGGGGGNGDTQPRQATVPTIIAQPQDQSVFVGGSATFEVAVDGSGPIALQWRKNGLDIPGANGLAYTMPTVTLADSQSLFDVVASNQGGTTISVTATLTVITPQPPASAQVDTETQSALVSLGTNSSVRSSGEAGPQRVATQGQALISATPQGGAAVPYSYDTTLTLEAFEHPQFYFPLSLNATTLPLTSHAVVSIENYQVDKFAAAMRAFPGSSAILAETIVIAMRSGISNLGAGIWKIIGSSQSGTTGSGVQSARGAYLIGEPTLAVSVDTIVGGTYSGFGYAGFEYVGSALSSFHEITTQASATYDKQTHKVTIRVFDFQRYIKYINMMSTSLFADWEFPAVADTSTTSRDGLGCIATVDPATNFFSCELKNDDAAISGVMRGKFYGENGEAIGATFAMTGLFGEGGSFSDGMVGAIMLKR